MNTIAAKTILIRNKSTAWFGASYNMNLYRGCCHGCIYCDSRSDCYHVENFPEVAAKAQALPILQKELARKTGNFVVATGAMSDPYNPYEAGEKLTRHALELLSAYGFGVGIATKSDLIVRDIDVLRELAQQAPAICKITITTCREDLAAKIEPGAPSPARRLDAIRKLAQAGIFCGILLMPVLPWISDDPQDILHLVDAAHEAGARFIYPAFGLTMRAGQREYFYQELARRFPGEKYPEKYQNKYGNTYSCSVPRAKELWNLFSQRCRDLGLLFDMREIVAAYKQGYDSQLCFY